MTQVIEIIIFIFITSEKLGRLIHKPKDKITVALWTLQNSQDFPQGNNFQVHSIQQWVISQLISILNTATKVNSL